jgi:cystathionine beta-lyase/cystathionine gamma-synthase
MSDERAAFDTRLIHAGELRPRVLGAVVTPVFQTAMYEYAGEDEREALTYVRLNNTPNHQVLHAKLADLENAEAALVTASGMAAISAALFAVLRPGDHLLAQDCLYGGTHGFVTRDLPELGVEVSFVPGDEPAAWERALRPTTRAFYLESVSNPLMEVPELEAAVGFARAHGLATLIDNTFPSPFNFRPAEHGVDLSLHSATKYLNGHSDLVAGAIIGRAELVDAARRKLVHLGAALDPHACFLLQRGLKTLALRMRRHNETALELARALEAHPAVARVHHPGLESHPGHARAARLFDGFGGMLSVELAGGAAAARSLLQRLTLPVVAPSLGGVESLVTLPARTSHSGLSPDERARLGIADGLVRVSTGIEDTGDLIDDFRRALAP